MIVLILPQSKHNKSCNSQKLFNVITFHISTILFQLTNLVHNLDMKWYAIYCLTGTVKTSSCKFLSTPVSTSVAVLFAVTKLAQYSSAQQDHHWKDAKRIFRYLKGIINHEFIIAPATHAIIAFAYASFACSDPRMGGPVTLTYRR